MVFLRFSDTYYIFNPLTLKFDIKIYKYTSTYDIFFLEFVIYYLTYFKNTSLKQYTQHFYLERWLMELINIF